MLILLNYMLIHARLDYFAHSITMEALTPTRYQIQGWEAWPHAHLNEKLKSINIC